MVLVKNLKFCKRFVLCKIHPEKVLCDVLVGKKTFIDNIYAKLTKKKYLGTFYLEKTFL